MKPPALIPAEFGRLVVPVLRPCLPIAAAYLLGSALSGRLRDDSDIDIAVLPHVGRAITIQERLRLAADLQQQIGRPVDLGVLTSENLVYAYEAILKGQRLFAVDRDAVAEAENRLLGGYFQLREDRHEVETAYAA